MRSRNFARRLRAGLVPLTAFVTLPFVTPYAHAADPVPSTAPAYFGPTYQSAISAPLPASVPKAAAAAVAATASTATTLSIYNAGGIPSTVPQLELDTFTTGQVATYQPAGTTTTATNAFFQSLGNNGRACVTCHEPPSGMSVSLSNIVARAQKSKADPIFAPVDGANCPNQAANGIAFNTGHSLLLTRGLFRIFLPVPLVTTDVNPDGSPNPHPVEYKISVISDPTTCNLTAPYNSVVDSNGVTRQMISVFRRPLISANLRFKTTTLADIPSSGFPPIDLVTGEPLPIDPNTGLPESGNIMSDGREPTLQSQAVDATLGHAQASQAPTATQVSQIVAFETGIFAAQRTLKVPGSPSFLSLDSAAKGGPIELSGQAAAQGPTANGGSFDLFDTWSSFTGNTAVNLLRQSILRGETIFNTRPVTISNVSGFNNLIGNPVTTVCASCHGQLDAGSDPLPVAGRDLGIGGTAATRGGPAPSPNLPIFQITCNSGVNTVFNGGSVTTNDPGMALVTGRCGDIGRFMVPSLRGVSARAPFFTDGSAPGLIDVVNFYNNRFGIGLSTQDTTDLVNFLKSL